MKNMKVMKGRMEGAVGHRGKRAVHAEEVGAYVSDCWPGRFMHVKTKKEAKKGTWYLH